MNLVDRLEVWGFEEEKIIFKDFSLGSILEVKPRDISCATDELLNSLKGVASDFLNGLPEKLFIQFVQVTGGGVDQLIERHESAKAPSANELSCSLLAVRTERLKKLDLLGEIPMQKLYVILRRPFVKPHPRQKRRFRLWEKKDELDWSRSILEPELILFRQMEESIKKGLENLGLASRTLSEKETYELLFDQWNPNHPISSNDFNVEDIRDDLLLNDLVISTKGFMLGQVHHRVLSLKIMPEKTFATMAEKLRELPFDSRLFLTIEVLDQAKEDMALQTQRRIAYAMFAGKKGVSDLESAAKLRDIEAILAKRVSGETKIFSVALNIVLRSENEAALDSQVENVLSKMRELSGSEGMLESLAASSVFFNMALPNARCIERTRRMTTDVLADFLPIFGTGWVTMSLEFFCVIVQAAFWGLILSAHGLRILTKS